ncbi:glutathione synthase [Ruminococcus albus]|uniref:Glutamate--cysteine ligase n=1 Tax=Ruminococcus albus TaxID=1264 RepID=A0A1I1F3C2_RUMAL|nr:glutathione synthase [Ruminococcus albus]SFB93456.1 glutamate--cysteine ligase [Ruminococcus albus]
MKNQLIYKGNFGLERETLRVDKNGRLSQTAHPFEDDGEITRDFCENQIELVTPVCSSIDVVMKELERLDKKVRKTLDDMDERIWLYSNPPHFSDDSEIPVADFKGDLSGKRFYREKLEIRYGKRLMLFSGIHFNFSFDDEYLKSISSGEDFSEFKNSFYLRLYKQLSRHSWLPLLLTAASPVYDRSLYEDGANGAEVSRYSSIRSSERGYWNSFVPTLKFDSLSAYVDSIQKYVDEGKLFSASELYMPIRLKPKGENSIENFANGVSHIELRMFDLNPLEPQGINANDLRFAHLLAVYLSEQPDFEYTDELQIRAVHNHRNAALLDLEGVTIDGIPILERAEQILDKMSERFSDNAEYLNVIAYEKTKLSDRLCNRIINEKIYG